MTEKLSVSFESQFLNQEYLEDMISDINLGSKMFINDYKIHLDYKISNFEHIWEIIESKENEKIISKKYYNTLNFTIECWNDYLFLKDFKSYLLIIAPKIFNNEFSKIHGIQKKEQAKLKYFKEKISPFCFKRRDEKEAKKQFEKHICEKSKEILKHLKNSKEFIYSISIDDLLKSKKQWKYFKLLILLRNLEMKLYQIQTSISIFLFSKISENRFEHYFSLLIVIILTAFLTAYFTHLL